MKLSFVIVGIVSLFGDRGSNVLVTENNVQKRQARYFPSRIDTEKNYELQVTTLAIPPPPILYLPGRYHVVAQRDADLKLFSEDKDGHN